MLDQPAPPPGHPRDGTLWVAGWGSGLARFHVSGKCSRAIDLREFAAVAHIAPFNTTGTAQTIGQSSR